MKLLLKFDLSFTEHEIIFADCNAKVLRHEYSQHL